MKSLLPDPDCFEAVGDTSGGGLGGRDFSVFIRGRLRVCVSGKRGGGAICV